MAIRKNNRINDDEDACSTAANKRRRIDVITDFPSIHRFPPRNTTAIGADLRLSSPAGDNDPLSSVIPQQNFLISYQINQMEEFWRKNLAEEVKKRKDMEARLKQKEEVVNRFRQMYYFYKERAFLLEQMIHRSVAGQDHRRGGAADAPLEEVESSSVDRNSVGR